MSFIFSYIFWHYSKALKNIFGIFANFFWVTYKFFSLPLLVKTFFYPWRNLGDSYPKQFSPEAYFGTLVVNTMMRLVSMCVKFVVIVVGIISLILLFVFEIIFFLIWIVLPAIIVWLLYAGIQNIF